MGKYTVKYSSQAPNDLRGIHAYIKYNLASPVDAQNQTKRIRDAIQELDIFLNGYPLADIEAWHKAGMYKLAIDNYVVFYFVNDGEHTVNISRFFYPGRNVEALAKQF